MNITGTEFKDAALVVIGNLFIVVLAAFALQTFIQKNWGGMIGLIAGGALVGWIVWSPTSFVAFLTWVYQFFAGGGA